MSAPAWLFLMGAVLGGVVAVLLAGLDRCSYCGRLVWLPRLVVTVASWVRPICRGCERDMTAAGKLARRG